MAKMKLYPVIDDKHHLCGFHHDYDYDYNDERTYGNLVDIEFPDEIDGVVIPRCSIKTEKSEELKDSEAIKNFKDKIENFSKPIDPEVQTIINDFFWEMLK